MLPSSSRWTGSGARRPTTRTCAWSWSTAPTGTSFSPPADAKLIRQLPPEPQPPPTELPLFTAMVDRFRTMPKATIAVIEGRCRGGGSELVLGMDLRFAALGRARLAQPEVTVGIIPGGGGTQRLPRLIGRGRALEVILGCDDVDAETAEQ